MKEGRWKHSEFPLFVHNLTNMPIILFGWVKVDDKVKVLYFDNIIIAANALFYELFVWFCKAHCYIEVYATQTKRQFAETCFVF